MKKALIFISLTLAFMCLVACSSNKSDLAEESYTVEIEIENYGTITAVLDAKTAPITVENFVNLARSGFYDGLTFHRIIEGFMMQGGDPNGDGISNDGVPSIKGEFAYNGVPNNIKHTRGTLSMARSNSYNSASSQFFIIHEDSPHLNDQYAAFGRVTDGMDIVDKICKETPVTDSNGSVPEGSRPVIKQIRVIE